MDKTAVIVLTLCAALFGFWLVEQNKFAQEQARWAQAHPQAATPGTSATINGTPANSAAAAAAYTTAAPPVTFDTNAPEQTIVLTNGPMRYTFTSRGGGLKTVEMLQYPETVSVRWKGQVHNSDPYATLNAHVNLPVLAVLGDPDFVGDGNFTLTRSGDVVRAIKALPDGLVIAKEFQLSSNYLINASVTIKNTSGLAMNLMPQEIAIGTATPMDVDDMALLWGAMWFDGTNAVDYPMPAFSAGGPPWARHPAQTEIRAGNGDVVWASAHNQFFTILAMPKDAAQQMIARTVTLPRFQDAGAATNNPPPQGVQTTLLYPAQMLAANAAIERDITLYAGPKELRTLTVVAEQRQNHADLVMNFGNGYFSFWGVGTFFAKVLLSAMNALHDLTTLGYGWVIVLITVLIKVIFWPLTAKSMRSMKRMQALAPEVAALKEKYKDDVQKFTQKQMELWKKHKVSPMSGCLPMLIQMPVFIGFFTMIRSAIELRGASFLWAVDLSKPDTLFMIPGITFLPVISTPEGLPFNLLPILMGGAMLWQSHLQPPSPGMDPAQQKMMRWLPAIFILFLYNYSSGLALYWTVNNLLTILQTKMTRNLKDPLLPAAATPALTAAPKKKK